MNCALDTGLPQGRRFHL